MPLITGSIPGPDGHPMPFILAEDMFPGQPEDSTPQSIPEAIQEVLTGFPDMHPTTRLLIEAALEAQRTGQRPPGLLKRLRET